MTHGRQPKQLNKTGGEAELVQREAGLQHQLSAAQVAMIALGSTIGTGLFLTSAISVKLAGPAVAKYGGKFLFRAGNAQVMEGKFDYSRMVVVEFPDAESAKKYFHSREYQEARDKRLGAADFNLIILEG